MKMDQLITKAQEGRRFWLDNNLDNYEFVLLLYEEELSLRDIYLDIFQEKLACEHSRGIILSSMPVKEIGTADCLLCNKCDMDNIIQLYSLYEFTDRLIIASLDKPFGRSIYNFIGYKELSIRDIIAMAIFKISAD